MSAEPAVDVTMGYDEFGKKVVENHVKAGRILKMLLFDTSGKVRYKKTFGNSAKEDMEFFLDENGKVRYEGHFNKCEKNGSGIYYDEFNNAVYEGTFVNGMKHGYGCEYNATNVMIYSGEFESDKRCGFGRDFCPNSGAPLYEGSFKNN